MVSQWLYVAISGFIWLNNCMWLKVENVDKSGDVMWLSGFICG